MNDSENKGFKNLSSFCDDDFDDPWENSESKVPLSSFSERYTQKELIATGGMKEIYKVYDTKMNRYIAMAQLIPDSPEELCEKFLDEATLTASLEHPNIISVYDLGVNEKLDPYFTMELKVGKSLDDIISHASSPLEELLEIFLKICDAISYAHSNQVIHLDLKPDNIQVGQHGEVQVCDWGLSRKLSEVQKQNTINGTPGYMAPEQSIKGETLDYKSDVFALGALLYSLLTGTRPIEGGVNTVLNTTVNKKIPSPLERFPNKNISESLDAVVRKAMAQKKEDRYPNVDELRKEVQNYLTGRSTQAENAGFVKELKLFIKRNKQVCLVVLCAACTLLLGASLFIAEIQKSKKTTEKALTELKETHSELISSKQQEKELFSEKEKALKMYIEANKKRQEIYLQLLDQELKQAYDLMVHPLYYNSPKESLDKSLKVLKSQYERNKNSQIVNNLIVLNLFVSQKFSEIKKYKSSKYEILQTIADKYANEAKTEYGILDEKTFVELLKDLNKIPLEFKQVKHDTVERMICYMVNVRRPIYTSTDVLRELLISWNPDWDSTQMKYHRSSLTLRLKGKNLSKIIATAAHSSSLCFLRFLKIDTLDIRGTSIPNLGQIDGLSINKIDIRDSPIRNLHPHGATKGIKEVILSKGQFVGENDNRLPRSVKLIYK